MTIKQARKTLGKLSKNMTDAEVQGDIDTARLLANLALDTIMKMSPEERQELLKNK